MLRLLGSVSSRKFSIQDEAVNKHVELRNLPRDQMYAKEDTTQKLQIRMSCRLLICNLCLNSSFCMRFPWHVQCTYLFGGSSFSDGASFYGVSHLAWSKFLFLRMIFVHCLFVNSMGSRIVDAPKKDACQLPCRSWIRCCQPQRNFPRLLKRHKRTWRFWSPSLCIELER
jgi:hypothetical protein